MSFIGIFGKRHEEERLEASMLDSFISDLQTDSERLKRRLLKRAETNPQETVVLLLRNYDREEEHIRGSIHELLAEMATDRSVLTIIMGNMVHPSRNVRKAVQSFLGKIVGPHAAIYASLYEQTMLQVAMSKRKDVPVEDIVALAELSKETLMDGEVMEAIRDIGFCLDHVKHRYQSLEQMRDYLSDFLKMAPELSRMGVYSSSLEEPLRKAMKAARNRSFDETREIIEERTMEGKLRHDLRSLALEIRGSVKSKPSLDTGSLSVEDREELSTLRGMAESIEMLLGNDRRTKAMAVLHGYMEGFRHGVNNSLGPRAHEGDQGAVATMYTISLTCVKLASYLIPVTAEGAYLEGFKSIEQAVSIQVVVLPIKLLER